MKSACVIGHPIAHSKSPLIHGYWLEEHGIAGRYTKQDVTPADLPAFVERAWRDGLAGFNATAPHKEALLHLVEPDAIARAVGAVNTVFRGENGWHGTNTDGLGWWRSLPLAWQDPSKLQRVLVLGAGGAAQALVNLLVQKGCQVTLSNRTQGKAEDLAAAVNARHVNAHQAHVPQIQVAPWQGAQWDGRGYDLLVNTTICGLKGEHPLTLVQADPELLVSDLIYVPLETHFLASAAALGAQTVDGLGMLLHQAGGGFERWFGVRPEVTPALRDAVLAP